MILDRFLRRWTPAPRVPAPGDSAQEEAAAVRMDDHMHHEVERQVRWLETKANVMRAERHRSRKDEPPT